MEVYTKKWTGRRVLEAERNDEIRAETRRRAVEATGDETKTLPHWSPVVSQMWEECSDAERITYDNTAAEWRLRGPPDDIKKR